MRERMCGRVYLKEKREKEKQKKMLGIERWKMPNLNNYAVFII